VGEALPKAKQKLAALAKPLVPDDRAGDFAQALMDLGSGICLPKKPRCDVCPIAQFCDGLRLGIVETLPRKAPKAARPLKRGAAFVAIDRTGAIYLERRPANGLLGAMLQPPLGAWRADFPKREDALAEAPFTGTWRKQSAIVRHGFTHFELEMEVYVAHFRARPNGEGMWLGAKELKTAALPTVMRKLIERANETDTLPLLLDAD
jgi:A/G-specific adenine glycosylase